MLGQDHSQPDVSGQQEPGLNGSHGRKSGRREQRPSFAFYPQDFLASAKVRRMSAAARGAYITLLCDQWLGGPLDTDPVALADSVGMDLDEFEREWAGPLGRCFELRDGGFVNARLERERERLDERARALAEAGARGGAAKAKRSRAIATPEPGDSQATARPQPGLARARSRAELSRAEPELGCAGSESEPEKGPSGAEPDPTPASPRRAKHARCTLEEHLVEFQFATLRSDVIEAARAWSGYRRERRPKVPPWGPVSWRPALRDAISNPDGFCAGVQNSIRQRYAGLIIKEAPAKRMNGHAQTTADIFAAGREAARLMGEDFDTGEKLR